MASQNQRVFEFHHCFLVHKQLMCVSSCPQAVSYQRVDYKKKQIQQINPKEERLNRLETVVQQISEQLTAL